MTGTGGDRLDLLVILGTDHHPFDRLVGWVDEFLAGADARSAAQPAAEPAGGPAEGPPSALVQHGSSAPPKRADGLGIVAYEDLQALMRRATVVVTHGGPATMLEVRRQGRRPVVVPRDPTLGEHIDQHQQEFSRRMAQLGLVTLCEDQEAFDTAVDAALRHPAAFAVTDEENQRDSVEVATAVRTTGAIIDGLALARARRRGRR